MKARILSLTLVLGIVACGESKHRTDGDLVARGGSGGQGAAGNENGGSGLGEDMPGGAAGDAGAFGGSAGASHAGRAGGGAAGASGAGGSGPTRPGRTGPDGLTRADGQCELWPAIADTPERVVIAGKTLKTSDHDCTYSLTNSVAVLPDGGIVRLLFHYDVNGDGVDDLFVSSSVNGGSSTVTLVASTLTADGELSFEPVDCTLDVPVGYSYFLRDVDGDGVRDFVIGKDNGVLVLVNRAAGPQVTVDYDFPDASRGNASLMDAAVGDFDGNGKLELAVGFDRTPDGQNVETGVLLFDEPGSAAADHGPDAISKTAWQVGGLMPPTEALELGYLAAVDAGHTLVGVTMTGGWEYGTSRFEELAVSFSSPPSFLQRLMVAGHETAFVGMQSDVVAFDPLVDSRSSLSFPTKFTHDLERDFGGGTRNRSYFLLDLDGDGDDDLVETNLTDPSRTVAPALAIHTGDSVMGPAADAQLLDPDDYDDPRTELPFLALGAAQGRLLVSGYDGESGAPLRVLGLACK